MHRIAACVEVKDPEQQQNEGLHPPTVQAARDVTQESQPSKHRVTGRPTSSFPYTSTARSTNTQSTSQEAADPATASSPRHAKTGAPSTTHPPPPTNSMTRTKHEAHNGGGALPPTEQRGPIRPIHLTNSRTSRPRPMHTT